MANENALVVNMIVSFTWSVFFEGPVTQHLLAIGSVYLPDNWFVGGNIIIGRERFTSQANLKSSSVLEIVAG
jgi:hypothetical protein